MKVQIGSAIRRSIKGEKSDTKPHHISITPKSAIAILPPKKVIKALFDYEPDPNSNQELGFTKGDFFHVISREDDPDWYEACNPLISSARGLVPVSYFEVIGKTERQSAGSSASGASNTIPPDSGYSEKGRHSRTDSSETAKTPGHGRMSSISKGAMVYGIVKYDFNAERPDELEAKEGEAIIVIAQSNPEWFVAKPIGRLGGPGLIPVSFIEIRDMTTFKAVADPQLAVQQAGVPKVEEWKRLARDYKETSIELGKLKDFKPANANSVQRELERISLSNGSQQPGATNGNSYSQYTQQSNGSRPTQDRTSSTSLLAPISASIPRYCFENDKYWYIIECVLEDGRHWELARFYENFYDFQIALLQEFPREADQAAGTRILPFMPGPVTYVTDAISNGRRESLNEYVKKLLALPPYISKCHLVRQLFTPREGDWELDPRTMGEDYRLSSASQPSSITNSLSRSASRQSSKGQMNGSNGYPTPSMPSSQQRSNHQRNQPSGSGAMNGSINGSAQAHSNHRAIGDTQYASPMNRQPSSLTQASGISSNSAGAPSAPNASTTNVASGALKIKVFFEDDLIAIRVPSDIGFKQLRDKLKDRLKVQENVIIQYKDEPSNGYAELLSDRDLDVALQRNPKLTLYVGIA